jgi:hypothetical protein
VSLLSPSYDEKKKKRNLFASEFQLSGKQIDLEDEAEVPDEASSNLNFSKQVVRGAVQLKGGPPSSVISRLDSFFSKKNNK